MPTYEYQCQKCGHEFEREQRIVEDPIKKCPSCKANKAKRLISKTSFVLKGSGWYDDLYSSSKPSGGSDEKSEPSSDASESSSSASESSSDASKGDSKSESKKSESEGSGDSKKSKAKKSAA